MMMGESRFLQCGTDDAKRLMSVLDVIEETRASLAKQGGDAAHRGDLPRAGDGR
jgi:hypothetical protein